MVLKYFLLVLTYLFILYMRAYTEKKILVLIMSSLVTFLLYIMLLQSSLWMYFLILDPQNVVLFFLTFYNFKIYFKSMIHFLINAYTMYKLQSEVFLLSPFPFLSFFPLCLWMFTCYSSICWGFASSNELLLHLCKKSIQCIC